jgi:hypothetical protein
VFVQVPSGPLGYADIFTMNADGSGTRQVTTSTLWDFRPDWGGRTAQLTWRRSLTWPACYLFEDRHDAATGKGWGPGGPHLWFVRVRPATP